MTTPTAALPMTRAEILALGWDRPDIVIVTGDAYVDHPSFAAALIGRTLQAAGFRVAILPQPDWRSAEPFRALGVPRLFWGVSAGNMDSMINHYTASRLPRSDDAYTPGGVAGARPDRATNVYSQRCREAAPGVPVIAGGVEASLRRLAHYDYWSETVRPSMLVSCKADLLVFGMGERAAVEIARRLAAGEPVAALRDIRGTAYLLGAGESLPAFAPRMLADGTPDPRRLPAAAPGGPVPDGPDAATVRLPSFEEVCGMRRIMFSTAVSCFVAIVWLGLAPAFAGQKGHPPTATAKHETPKATPTAQPTSPKAALFITRIESNSQLMSRLQPLLPSGMTLSSAAQGFKNEGQFIAALHVSQNLKIPFAQLKAEMVRPDRDSLGQAIHDLQPSANAKAAVKTAEQEARADIKATKLAKADAGKDKDDR